MNGHGAGGTLANLSEINDIFSSISFAGWAFTLTILTAAPDFEGRDFACGAGAVGAEAVTAVLCFVLGVEAEVDQGVVAAEEDMRTSPPWPPEDRLGDEPFATEGPSNRCRRSRPRYELLLHQ